MQDHSVATSCQFYDTKNTWYYKSMRRRHLPSAIVMTFIPLYVLGVFASDVFAPSLRDTGEGDKNVTTLVFVGDMMFDRYVRERAQVSGYMAILQDLNTELSTADIAMGNLEGPITTFTSVSDWRDSGPNHYRFTFATTVASTLSGAGFDALFLSNNHVLNFGTEGLNQTKAWLSENGIKYAGAPDEPYVPLYLTSTAPKIAVYTFDTWYSRDAEKLSALIAAEPEDVFVVVYAHWGDEYEKTPNAGQREFAHAFIDAGADLVIGSHPHVVQTKELYKEKWIYYSLGNFVFDQYFNEDVSCGAVLTVSLQDDFEYAVAESFITLERDGTTKPSTCLTAVPEEL